MFYEHEIRTALHIQTEKQRCNKLNLTDVVCELSYLYCTNQLVLTWTKQADIF